MKPDDVDLEAHVGIDPEQLSEDVRVRLAEFVANREQRLVELRERAVDAEQEAQVLQGRVQSLQERVATLEDQVEEREYAGTDLEPSTLLSTFGDALSSETVRTSDFVVSDISVDLRANVVSTEDGVRVNLPEPGTRPHAESLSELRFSVRSDPTTPELDLEEVPDLVGMTEETARETLTDAGFEVGSVETVAADAEAGRVVDQLPSPFSLAEPGAAVDLEVAEGRPAEMVDLTGRRLPDAVQFVGDRFTLRDITAVESEEPPGTVIDQEPEPGTEIAEPDRLSLTISAFRSPTQRREDREAEEEPEAEVTEQPEMEALEDEDEEYPLVERDVTEIDGIGDTYGQRLRNAGIESLADLAVAEPIEVADAANVSRDRATDWIEAVRTRIQSRTGADEDADGPSGEER